MKTFRTSAFAAIAICFIAGQANSQLFTNNNAAITITSGAQLTVKGDVQNNGAAVIGNSGTIDVSGNWIHNASNNCFGTSQGTVILNGTNQSIGGTNTTAFNNLALQGSGVKTMLINTTVGGANAVPSGQLSVGAVVMDLNSKILTVSNAAGSAITFGSGNIRSEDTDHSSAVVWQINSSTGAHTVPFGSVTGDQVPVTFNNTSGNAGNVRMSTYRSLANNTPLPVSPVAVTHVRNNSGVDNSANTVDRFYQIDPSGNPTATVTFTYAPAENAANGNTGARAQRWNAAQDAWEPSTAGQFNPTTQSVAAPFLTSWGSFALALESSPLPVELIEFTAQPVNNEKVLCTWITASEIDNDYFNVERSRDGENFEIIGTVQGAGNSNNTLRYDFTDNNPYRGISYYRLKQTDFDGRFSNSPVVAVELRAKNEFQVYPNPAVGELNLAFSAEESSVTVRIFDASGKLVSLIENAGTGQGREKLDVSGFARGVYSVQLISGQQMQQMKVVLH